MGCADPPSQGGRCTTISVLELPKNEVDGGEFVTYLRCTYEYCKYVIEVLDVFMVCHRALN